MGLDLRGVRVPLNSQALHELLRDFDPIFFGVSNLVCVEIANSPVELTSWNDSFNFLDLMLQTVSKVSDLLSHGCGCCTLTMGPGHHWHPRIGHGQAFQLS